VWIIHIPINFKGQSSSAEFGSDSGDQEAPYTEHPTKDLSEELYPHSRACRFEIQSILIFIIQYVLCYNSEDFFNSNLLMYLPTQYVPKGGDCA